MISFTVPTKDLGLIDGVAARAAKMDIDANRGQHRKLLEWRMDITATHANGCPLDLARLLDADDFNFAHDVFGIARHLDRDGASATGGQLLNCFVPRFATKERKAA